MRVRREKLNKMAIISGDEENMKGADSGRRGGYVQRHGPVHADKINGLPIHQSRIKSARTVYSACIFST